MNDLYDRIQESVRAIRGQVEMRPQVAIILGTGLGALAREIEEAREINFDEIPGFADSTVATHAGKLVLGRIGDKTVAAMEGRLHFYEGHSLDEVTFPVRVLRALGAEVLIVSSACGCMNPQFQLGDLILLEDHINLMGTSPLIGANDERLGPRYPDLCEPYDLRLLELVEALALAQQIRAHRGVYVAVTGPNLETRAEYRFLRAIGADIVGMSTVPEVLVAVHAGLRVLGISCVTDRCLPDALQPANIEEIIRVANEAEPKLTCLVKRFIEEVRLEEPA